MKKLVTAETNERSDPLGLLGPSVSYHYMLVTKKLHPFSKKPVIHMIPCVTDDNIFDGIRNFMSKEIDNPDAVRGVHYDIGIYRRDQNWERDLLESMYPPKPKPDAIFDRALYPMKTYRSWNYNIFLVNRTAIQLYAGIVFDRNRRPYYQTLAFDTIEKTINSSRDIIDLLVKGQCIPEGMAFKVDEGKAIREKEEALRTSTKKSIRRGKACMQTSASEK
jgi:hypothetical protein